MKSLQNMFSYKILVPLLLVIGQLNGLPVDEENGVKRDDSIKASCPQPGIQCCGCGMYWSGQCKSC